MKRCFVSFILLLFFVSFTLAQSAQTLTIRKYSHQHQDSVIKDYIRFLSISNTAIDTQNIQKNAAYIMDMMHMRGIGNVRLLQATTAGVPPAVYGEVLHPGAKQTLIFYAHYDGQPVNPAQWAKGLY